MQSRVSSFFGSYDLFGKAFPGTAFLLGLISLLPSSSLQMNLTRSGVLVAALIVLILVLGFMFGQALHSIAVQIEGGFYSISSSYYKFFIRIKSFLIRLIELSGIKNSVASSDKDHNEFTVSDYIIIFVTFIWIAIIVSFSREPSFVAGIITGIIINVVGPIERFRAWVKQTLSPHRRLFEERISLVQNQPGEDRLVNQFLETAESLLDMNSPGSNGPGLKSMYVMVMSHLEYVGGGRARQFQAILSFCRSMWVTLFTFSFLYLLISVLPLTIIVADLGRVLIPTTFDYKPLVQSLLGGKDGMLYFGVLMFIAALLFMEGERQYKSYFVEYIMADFLTSTNKSLNLGE